MARAQHPASRQAPAQPATQAPDEAPMIGIDPATPLGRFSASLAERYPDTLIKRFVMPSRIRECREVFIREIDSQDEIMAASMADTTMSVAERNSERLANEAEKRELIRISIVGLGKLPAGGGDVVYEAVGGDDGIPLVISKWKYPTWIALYRFFPQVNGVSEAEMFSGMMEACVVGALAPPRTSGTPARDSGSR